MTSSKFIEDYSSLRDLDVPGISPTNQTYLQQFIVRKRAHSVSLNTINTYVAKIESWIRGMKLDDAKQMTEDDVLAEYLRRMDMIAEGKYSAATLDGDVVALKQFANFLFGDDAKNIVTIKRRRQRNTRLSSDYLTPADVKKMRDYVASAGDIRGVALIMICFGTGARISEILDAKVSDLEIKLHNMVLTVDGKTGMRKIPFVTGMPEIINWINCHPIRGPDGKADPNAPLFTTYCTRGHSIQKLNKKTVESFFANVARKAGIPPDVKANPHAFRHLLATIMAKDLTIKEMNLFFGWSSSSTTSLTYIHTSVDALENNILGLYGIKNEESPEDNPEWFVKCPCCGHILPSGSTYCTRCHGVIDPAMAIKVDQAVEDQKRMNMKHEYVAVKEGKELDTILGNCEQQN